MSGEDLHLKLVDLSTEVLVHILKYLDPIRDLPKVSKVCRRLHSVCKNRALKIRHITNYEAQPCNQSILLSVIDPETPELYIRILDPIYTTPLLSKVFSLTQVLTKLTLKDSFLYEDVWRHLPETLKEIQMDDSVFLGHYSDMFRCCNLTQINMNSTYRSSHVIVKMCKDLFELSKRYHVDIFEDNKNIYCCKLDFAVASKENQDDFMTNFNKIILKPMRKGWIRKGRVERQSENSFKFVLHIDNPTPSDKNEKYRHYVMYV